MEYVLIYALFAITTSLTAIYELLNPVINRRLSELYTVENKFLIYFVFFLLSLIIAPLIFVSCIVPSIGNTFRESLYEGLFPIELG